MTITAGLIMINSYQANAKTIHYVKSGGTGNGTSWNDAAGSIQEQIDNAEAGDEIWVAAGIYYPEKQTSETDVRSKTFLLKDGVNLYGGFTGDETSIEDRIKSDTDGNGKIDAWEFTGETVLSGNIDGEQDVWVKNIFTDNIWRWTFSGMSGNCKIVVICPSEVTEETVLDGFTVSGGSDGVAGGIYTQGNTNIRHCIIAYNADRGIYNTIGSISNCYIHHNNITGIYNEKGIVSDCTIDSNARYVVGIASAGGGVVNEEGDIIGCTVTNNYVSTFYASSTGYVANPAAYGGGIYNKTGKIDRCVVMNNSVYCYNSATGGSMLSALAYGGGIYDNNGGIISNCCVFNNRVTAEKRSTHYTAIAAATGGGVSGTTDTKIYNTTIANNNRFDYNSGGTAFNCIVPEESHLNRNFVRPTLFTGTASSAQQEEELLQADWRLKEGSEYIDAGSIADLPEWLIDGTDLAGDPRTRNGKISLGAYEYSLSSDIGKVQLSAVTIFSDPTNNFVTVSGLQGCETLDLYSVNGQLVLSRKVSGKTETLPVNHLQAGIYFVKVDNGQTLKWVKK